MDDKNEKFCLELRARLISQGIIRPDPHPDARYRPVLSMSTESVKNLKARLIREELLIPGAQTHFSIPKVNPKTH